MPDTVTAGGEPRAGGRAPPAMPDPCPGHGPDEPVLPAMLASLPGFPADVREVLVRCLGLAGETESVEAVADSMGIRRSAVHYRLSAGLRAARRSFAWARRVEAEALARVGCGRVSTLDLAREPWAAGLTPHAVGMMLPRLTGEALRLRGNGDGARLCRRGIMVRGR